MVTSGAIALGMGLMELPTRPRTIDELQAASALGQGTLFRAYEARLAAEEVRAAQVLLTSFDLAVRVHYLNARRALRRLLDWRAVPVINENDTTATDEITFGDNDFLSAQVALLLGARLLVLLTDTDGLHTADPRHDPSAELVGRVDDFAELDRYRIGDRTSPLGSGGMRSKVAAAGMASAAGIPAAICNGTVPGTLVAAARDEPVGTRFAAHPERTPAFKLWLRHAKPVRGRVSVDAGRGAGAARARLQPAPGRCHRRRPGSSPPGTPSTSSATGSWSARGSSTTRPPSSTASRACSPSRSWRCCRAPPRRRSTATGSCSHRPAAAPRAATL